MRTSPAALRALVHPSPSPLRSLRIRLHSAPGLPVETTAFTPPPDFRTGKRQAHLSGPGHTAGAPIDHLQRPPQPLPALTAQAAAAVLRADSWPPTHTAAPCSPLSPNAPTDPLTVPDASDRKSLAFCSRYYHAKFKAICALSDATAAYSPQRPHLCIAASDFTKTSVRWRALLFQTKTARFRPTYLASPQC